MGFDHNTYTYDPPFKPEEMCVPPDSVQDQAFAVVETETGRELLILWSYTDLAEIDAAIVEFGGIGMPVRHPQEPIRLGGDYPQLFLNIREFQRRPDLRHFVWSPGLQFCLAPSCEAETYGMIAWKEQNGRHRLLLYPDKATARGILAQLEAEDPKGVALHRPYVDRCVLPEQSQLSVIELGPTTAWWFTWWYVTYRYLTEQIR